MIKVRSENVFQGYLNTPQKTVEELRDTGFFITGDLGIKPDDGRICIGGRQKDLIISGGHNTYPKEIEDVINDIGCVLESAVFGVSHPDFGECEPAAVIREPGASLQSDPIAPLLARIKHPRRYIFCAGLPRNTMGKVPKNLLRNEHSI
jgi:malonyl-CoA/methylmalonyl-CoA synthetase